MDLRRTRFLSHCLALCFVVSIFPGRSATAVVVRFGNSIEYVHPDEVELVQYCRKAGIGYNLNNQTSNPGGGGIVRTKEGRVIVLYINSRNALTLEQLKPLAKATHLSRFNCPWWADDDTLAFFTHPGRFPKVTGLNINSSKITDEGLVGLKNCPNIASMNIKSSSITDKGVLNLSKIPKLGFLRLHASKVTDKGVAQLANLPNMSFLELNDTQATDAALKHLGRLPKLHTLHLDGTSVTGRGLKHLAPLSRLRLLSLNNTPLDDRGLSELAEHPNLAKIEVLYLANTKITDAGCPTFEKLNALKVLALSGTSITDKGVRHIKDMPRLYNITFGDKVTEEGRRWLAENARFSPALQQQFRDQTSKKDKSAEKQEDLRTFQAGLKGVDALVFQLGQSSHKVDLKEVQQQLMEMGTDAIGPILEMAAKSEQRGHPLAEVSGFAWHLRNNSIAILEPVFADAMPELADHFAGSEGKRRIITCTLQQLDPEILPALEKWLSHESGPVRAEALVQMSRWAKTRRLRPGPNIDIAKKHNSLKISEQSRERVYSLLSDPDAKVRKAACLVVVACEDKMAAKAKVLTEAALRETDTMTARDMLYSLYFLAEQQPVGGDDLPPLVDGLTLVARKAENETPRYMAIARLGALGGKAQPAVAMLRELESGSNEDFAASAKRALDQIRRCPITLMRGADVPPDVQALVFALNTYDEQTIRDASDELVRRGPEMVRPMSIASRAEVSEYYARNAAEVVARWKQEEVLPLLRPAFNWTGTFARLFVIKSIGKMKWTELPDVVEKSLRGADGKVRVHTRSELVRLAKNSTGQASAEVVRLIAAELENPQMDWPVASNLTRALASCYPHCKEASSKLIDILNRDMQHASAYACSALGDIVRFQLKEKTDEREEILKEIRAAANTTKHSRVKRECDRVLSFNRPKPRRKPTGRDPFAE